MKNVKTSDAGTVNVLLSLSKDQLDSLLCAIESTIAMGVREAFDRQTPELLADRVEACDNLENSLDAHFLLPVYRELGRHWKGSRVTCRGLSPEENAWLLAKELKKAVAENAMTKPVGYVAEGRVAAAIRFLAFTEDETPSQYIHSAVLHMLSSQLEDGLYMREGGELVTDTIWRWLDQDKKSL